MGSENVTPDILRDQVTQDRYAEIRIPGRPVIQVGDKPGGDVIRATAQGEEETVLVQEPRSTVTREVGRTLLIIALVALLAVIAAVLLAIRQANRLASPSPTSRRRPSGSARATRGPGTSGTPSPSSTGSPTSSTPPPSASPAC